MGAEAMWPGSRYPPVVTTNLEMLVRRGAVLAAAAALPLLAAAPASADVPEGWSDPDPVPVLEALLILGAVPLGLFVLIVLAVYVPAMLRGERVAPGAPALENQWLGGPRKSTAELAGPDSQESEAGGASAHW